jgi:hypothetical protein
MMPLTQRLTPALPPQVILLGSPKTRQISGISVNTRFADPRLLSQEDPMDCALGQLRPDLQNLPFFRELIALHNRFHQRAR